MAAIGWYGPLIDLSEAASHICDYVQLLVFVHRSTPVQYKLSKGGEVVRTDIQVGDDTRSFFCVSIWQKKLGSEAFAGSVVLLHNVRITRFGDSIEARTVQRSSVQCLVRPSDKLLVAKGVDDRVGDCRVGIATKEKLKKVIKWVQRSGSSLQTVGLHSYQNKRQQPINWRVQEERDSKACVSLLELSQLTDSCKATFYASIGEIFLPFSGKNLRESEEERMFISRRLSLMGDKDLAEDLICTGCQLCGSPLSSKLESMFEQNNIRLYCQKSSNCLHIVSLIYRPFMLYVWDDLRYIPLLVTNKAAELLFGNITAEKVCSFYKSPNSVIVHKEKHSDLEPNTVREGVADLGSLGGDKTLGPKEKQNCEKNPNFYMIWLILLKLLLKQGKNSPLKFEAMVNTGSTWESGRFEMVSVSMPCLL